jgi:hypothetical protein
MVELDARLLPTPTMICADDRKVTPRNGEWRMDSGLRFTSARELSSWSIAVFGDERSCQMPALDKFVGLFESSLKKLGMRIYVPKNLERLVVYQRGRGDFEGTLLDAEKAAIAVGREAGDDGNRRGRATKVDMILCVIMNKSDGIMRDATNTACRNVSRGQAICRDKHGRNHAVHAIETSVCGQVRLHCQPCPQDQREARRFKLLHRISRQCLTFRILQVNCQSSEAELQS